MRENVYRKTGSPEVDKAWEDLGVDCEPAERPNVEARTF